MAWGNDAPAFGGNDRKAFGGFGADDRPAFGADDRPAFSAPRTVLAEPQSRRLVDRERYSVPIEPRAAPVEPRPPVEPVPGLRPEFVEEHERYERENTLLDVTGQRLRSGALGMRQGFNALTAEMGARLLGVLDEIDAGRHPRELVDPAPSTERDIAYQYYGASPEERAEIRSSYEQELAVDVGEMVEAGRRQAAIPRNPVVEETTRALDERRFGDAWRAFTFDPLGFLGQIGTESLPAMAPGIAAAPLVGPVAGIGGASFAVEFGPSIIAGLEDAGVDTSNAEAVMAALRDPETARRARAFALERAGIIGAFDAASGGLARVTLAPQLASQVVREGINAGAQMTAQAALGAGGEAAAQAATGQDLQLGQIAAEAAGEFVGAPAEVASVAAAGMRRQPQPQPDQPQPDQVAVPARPTVETAATYADPVPAGAVPASAIIGAERDRPAFEELSPSPSDPNAVAGIPAAEGLAPAAPPLPGRADLEALLADERPLAEIVAGQQQEAAAAELDRLRQQRDRLAGQNLGGRFTQQLAALDREIGALRRQLGATQGSGAQGDPVRMVDPEDVSAGAEQTAMPTPAQAEAGNYRKRHVKWQGLDASIETEQGQTRSGIAPDGTRWEVVMPVPYGYFRRSEGADGDHVDVYFGPQPDSPTVFVVDQIDPGTGRFDEHKVLAAFADETSALETYGRAFSDGSGPRRIGAVTALSVDEFKEWLARGKRRRPLSYQAPAPADPAVEQRGAPPAAAEAPAQPGAAPADTLFGAIERFVREGQGTLDVNRLARQLGADPAAVRQALQQLVGRGVRYNARTGRFARAPKLGPLDALQFIASRGGLRDDEGHELKRSRNAQRTIPQFGALIRTEGATVDAMGELLHEAGYFGDPAQTPRPTVAEVLDLLDAALAGRKIFSVFDEAEVAEREARAAAEEQAAQLRAAAYAVRRAADESGFVNLTDAEIAAAAELVAAEGLDPDEALVEVLERAAVAADAELAQNAADDRAGPEWEIPFDADIRGEEGAGPPAAPARGEPAGPDGGAAPGSAPARGQPRHRRSRRAEGRGRKAAAPDQALAQTEPAPEAGSSVSVEREQRAEPEPPRSIAENIRRGRAAIDALLKSRSPEREPQWHAMYRKGVGWISFLWEVGDAGLAHVIEGRADVGKNAAYGGEALSGSDLVAFLRDIPLIIANGRMGRWYITGQQLTRNIFNARGTVVLRPVLRSNRGAARITWIATAFPGQGKAMPEQATPLTEEQAQAMIEKMVAGAKGRGAGPSTEATQRGLQPEAFGPDPETGVTRRRPPSEGVSARAGSGDGERVGPEREEINPGPARTTFAESEAFIEATPELTEELKRLARSLFGSRLKIVLLDRSDRSAEDRVNTGYFGTLTAPDGAFQYFAAIALHDSEGAPRSREHLLGTLLHEGGVHYLRRIGVLDGQRWRLLAGKALEWRRRFRIDALYGDWVEARIKDGTLTPEQGQDLLDEEAVAAAIAAYRLEDARFGPRIDALMEAIWRFFDRIKNLLAGRGFTSWRDVFDEIREGRLREAAELADPGPQLEFELDRTIELDQTAYHGSAYDFDQFSLGAVGTGEGAQAFGWGLYFAGRREVAQHYRDKLSGRSGHAPRYKGKTFVRSDGSPVDWNPDMLADWGSEVDWILKFMVDNGHETIRAAYDALPAHKKSIGFLKRLTTIGHVEPVFEALIKKGYKVGRLPGRLYQVDLAPAEDEYLLWDKPLSEQSEKVKAALAKIPDEVWEEFGDELERRGMNPIERDDDAYDGSHLYRLLENYASEGAFPGHEDLDSGNPKKDASLYLLRLGIPGIKYLDGGSRGAGDGTYNYVIFDDKLVTIVDRHQYMTREQANDTARRNTRATGMEWFAQRVTYDGEPRWVAVTRGVPSFEQKPAIAAKSPRAGMERLREVEAAARPKPTETVDTLDGPREQAVIPGAERISDRELIERRAEARKTARKPQKDAGDLPLFDTGSRKQLTLFQRDPHRLPTTADRQAVAQNWLTRGQPIDRALRLPFDLFGGVSPTGEWRPGARLFDKAARVITSARVDPGGRFGWLSGVVEAARAGLIDRYGLEAEYVERERQRGLDERRVAMKGAEILKSLAEHRVGLEEARVLQAVLTGEAVPNEDWAKIAAPIRQAIDELGAEAVSLGLLSAESYERNRGAYLHRVYLRHEGDAPALARWVGQMMGRRRKRIIGDQFRGRGMFMDVPNDRVVYGMPEAELARGRNARLERLQNRIDQLGRRRAVVAARLEERSDEGAANMRRRMDVADRATVKKMVGDQRKVRPTGFQRGQVREQAAALYRLRSKAERAAETLAQIDQQIEQARQQVEEIDNRLVRAGQVQARPGERYAVLDRLDGDGNVTRRVFWPAGRELPERLKGYENRGEWEVRAVQNNTVTLWRDFTREERDRMGEILDARYTIGKTFLLMAHDLATGRFYRDIAAHPGWSQAEEPAEPWVDAAEYSRRWADSEIVWVRVPDTAIPKSGGKKRWGALAGRFVRAEIWRDLNELDLMQRPNFWNQLLTHWKLNKTARSPVVHMNNIMSNLMFMDLADVRVQDLVRGIQAYVRETQDYRDAVENGAFGSDLMSQEIRRQVLEPVLEELRRQNVAAATVQGRLHVLTRIAERIWSTAKRADRAMIDAYRMEDEVFRMATYLRRRSLGDSPKDAARYARSQFLDYDIRAPWVNAARRSVLPFIAYTYRAVPVIARSLATRPWKLAKYFAVAYALNALAYMLAPGDEDEERRSMREEEQGWTWIGVPRMLRMPWRDQYGNPVFLDIRRWIPAGDVFDTGQGHGTFPIPAPLQFGGPLMIGAELALNRSAFTGEDIINDLTDTWWERAKKTGGHLWKSVMPSAAWIPGSWYWDKIGRAITGGRDPQGRPYSVTEAAASSVGIKLKPQDVDYGFELHGRAFERVERELKAQMRRLERDAERGLISAEQAEAEATRLISKMGELQERQAETFGQ